eukprot:gene16323-biopygen9784
MVRSVEQASDKRRERRAGNFRVGRKFAGPAGAAAAGISSSGRMAHVYGGGGHCVHPTSVDVSLPRQRRAVSLTGPGRSCPTQSRATARNEPPAACRLQS